MRLTDLAPKLEGTLADGVLRFDCPLGHAHKFRVKIGVVASGATYPYTWGASGEFPDTLTLTPSIDAVKHFTGCTWHGFITNGEVK